MIGSLGLGIMKYLVSSPKMKYIWPYEGKPMVNKPLIGETYVWGGTRGGGGLVDNPGAQVGQFFFLHRRLYLQNERVSLGSDLFHG